MCSDEDWQQHCENIFETIRLTLTKEGYLKPGFLGAQLQVDWEDFLQQLALEESLPQLPVEVEDKLLGLACSDVPLESIAKRQAAHLALVQIREVKQGGTREGLWKCLRVTGPLGS